ncbi:MAG: LCP family protein [Lachnospiraceae bacterium]|nr:LCP family protein [Lachnospiraceae bacterium]
MSKKRHKFKKRYLLFLLIPILAAGIFVAAYIHKLNSQIQRPDEEKVEVKVNEDVVLEKDDEDESWDIALFGVDARDKSLDKGNRSDVVMIAHVDGKTKKVNLFSIYRDSYVNIPGKGFDKLTHAYSYGGYELALSTINTNYDMNIKKFVTVNFVALEDAVDLLGGIEVDVQQDEVKWINGYVTSLHKESGLNKVSLISGPGKQTLTGSQAVAYCRIRYTDGGDLKRAERQRTVLNEMFKKAKSTDVSTLMDIVDTMTKEIYTNLKTSEIVSLAKDVASYEIDKSEGFPYHVVATSDWCYADSSKKLAIVAPTNYIGDLETLHNDVLGYKNYVPSSKVKEYEQSLAGYQKPVTEDTTTENK